MKKGLLGILAVGIMSSAANAGVLSLRFAGGATEVTLAQSQSVTVEVLFAMNATDKKANKVTGIDARFDVGPLAGSGAYVVDGSTKMTITSISTPQASWTTAASNSLPATFNGSYFAAAGDPAGVAGPAGNATNQAPVVIMSFVLHQTGTSLADEFIVFRSFPPLPAVYNGSVQWGNRHGPDVITGAEQFEIGRGNPGFSRPGDYPGYAASELLLPLTIHKVPEPSALALMMLGGLALLRRRN